MKKFLEILAAFFKALFTYKKPEELPEKTPTPIDEVVVPEPENPVILEPQPERIIQFYVSGTLRFGSVGPDVIIYQTRLKDLGFNPGSIDGEFGTQVQNATILYQKANGLYADGIAGPKTLSSMGIGIKDAPVVKPVEPKPDEKLENLKKGTEEWYELAFAKMEYDPGKEASIKAAANNVISKTEVRFTRPELGMADKWYVLGVVLQMECSGDPKGILHNGQRIIGTGKKTTIVPIGKGPFATQLAADLDAIKGKFDKQDFSTIGKILKYLEAHNGLGYLKYHPDENSPYLWARTTINDGRGKYVADGKWDSNADADGQIGAAAILKELERMGKIKLPRKV